jgi:hypothetical protein
VVGCVATGAVEGAHEAGPVPAGACVSIVVGVPPGTLVPPPDVGEAVLEPGEGATVSVVEGAVVPPESEGGGVVGCRGGGVGAKTMGGVVGVPSGTGADVGNNCPKFCVMTTMSCP